MALGVPWVFRSERGCSREKVLSEVPASCERVARRSGMELKVLTRSDGTGESMGLPSRGLDPTQREEA